MKFSRAISQVRWFSFVETNVSKTISVLILRVVDPHQFNNLEDEDRDGLQNVGFYKTELPYLADSPRKLDYRSCGIYDCVLQINTRIGQISGFIWKYI